MSNFYEVKDPFAAGRDCRHGQLARSCEICELTAQLSGLQAKYDAVLSVIEEAKNPLEAMDCESASDAALNRDLALAILSRVNPKEGE